MLALNNRRLFACLRQRRRKWAAGLPGAYHNRVVLFCRRHSVVLLSLRVPWRML
jgi:hypothetical protein